MYRIYLFSESTLPYKHISLKRRLVPLDEKAEPVGHDGKMDESLSRTRRLFEDYALCNHFDLFVTLTFDPAKIDRYDYATVKKQLLRFFDNYRRRYCSDFRYMLIPEFHQDGAIHFHGLVTWPYGTGQKVIGACTPLKIEKRVQGFSGEVLEFVNNTKHYMRWPAFGDRFGYFSASEIRHYGKCISYIKKYITKELVHSGHAKGSRLLLKSNDLRKPELVYESQDMVALYRPDFEGPFCQVAWKDEHQTAPQYCTLQYEVDYLLDESEIIAEPFVWAWQASLPEAEQLEIV